MIERTDFDKKQIIFFFPIDGDKVSFRNDNLVIKNKEGKIKSQVTCYRIFLLFIVGDTSITTGILNRANKFGFSICLMNRNMKVYKFIGYRMEGNTLLRKRQYFYEGTDLGRTIIQNKIMNQSSALKGIRYKNELLKEAIVKLNKYTDKLNTMQQIERDVLMGIEGSASRVYFSRMFEGAKWKGRKPRIKSDYINASLDIGYTILFNMIDALVNVYGFDEYYGVIHTCFYMRKSLVCDLMEPFRPIVDYSTRKGINLNQIKEEHFKVFNGRYVLEWGKSSEYAKMYLSDILKYRDEMFQYIQDYYRSFMKGKPVEDFPKFVL